VGRRSRGEGTLYKEPDPKRRTLWRAERTVKLPDGNTARVTARGKTQKQALDRLTDKIDELNRAHPGADRLTLTQYLDRWLAFKRPQVRASTIIEYQRIVAHVTRTIGDVRLSRVSPEDVQRVMDDLTRRGLPGTANAVRRYLKGALRQAERWELLRRNPVRNLEPVRRPATVRGVWTPSECRRFLDAVRGSRYHSLFHALIFTGARVGELLALPWANVFPDRIVIDRTFARHSEGRVNQPKTRDSHRVVPIARGTFEVIRDARDAGSALAFPSGSGGMLSYSNARRALRSGVRRSGVPMVRIHDLRRTAATLWALNGLTPKAIQKLLGHATPHLALAVYTDVLDSQLAAAALDPERVLSGGHSGGLESSERTDSSDRLPTRVGVGRGDGDTRDP
jgi:integrase